MKKDVLFLLSHAEVYVVEEVVFLGFFSLLFWGFIFKSCIAQGGTWRTIFSLMTSLPKLSNSLLPAGSQTGSPEDIYGSARNSCYQAPRTARLNKDKLSNPTWSDPGEAREARQDQGRQHNCKQYQWPSLRWVPSSNWEFLTPASHLLRSVTPLKKKRMEKMGEWLPCRMTDHGGFCKPVSLYFLTS